MRGGVGDELHETKHQTFAGYTHAVGRCPLLLKLQDQIEFKCWKDSKVLAFKLKGLRVNIDKTKVNFCEIKTGQAEHSGR